jgi:hypothetical protein
MPDITMCKQEDCLEKDGCKRYTSVPNKYRQAYFIEDVRNGDGSCGYKIKESKRKVQMTVKEVIEVLKEMPEDKIVVMPDYAPVQIIVANDNYGRGVVIISDGDGEEDEIDGCYKCYDCGIILCENEGGIGFDGDGMEQLYCDNCLPDADLNAALEDVS